MRLKTRWKVCNAASQGFSFNYSVVVTEIQSCMFGHQDEFTKAVLIWKFIAVFIRPSVMEIEKFQIAAQPNVRRLVRVCFHKHRAQPGLMVPFQQAQNISD